MRLTDEEKDIANQFNGIGYLVDSIKFLIYRPGLRVDDLIRRDLWVTEKHAYFIKYEGTYTNAFTILTIQERFNYFGPQIFLSVSLR